MTVSHFHVCVVDDELIGRQRLQRLLEQDPRIASVTSFSSAAGLLDSESCADFDAYFLDVRMRGLDGVSLARRLPEDPVVVFVSAYDEYALSAFGVDAVDYLLKPIDLDAVQRGVDRVARRISEGSSSASLTIPIGRQLVRLVHEEIYAVVADGDYVTLISARGSFSLRNSLSHYEDLLPSSVFARCHRSTLVNLSNIERYVPSGSAMAAVLPDGSKVRVSRRFARNLRSRG